MIVFSRGKFLERIVNVVSCEQRDGYVNAGPRFKGYCCDDFPKTVMWIDIPNCSFRFLGTSDATEQ
jgi:hypothetical protein